MTTLDPIDPRDARIAQLEAENAALRTENAALQDRLDKLEHYLGLNSINSSMAPSSDSPQDRKKRKRRRSRTKRAPGAQPGHEGTTRELLPEDQVDAFEDHYPSQCDCGLELSSEQVVSAPVRHQQFELVPKLVECTEHRLHACQCLGCGKKTRAELEPRHRLGWGARLTALLGTLSVTLHATRGKLDWFVEHVLGAPSCKSTVHKYLEEVSEALVPAHAQARQAVLASDYIGCDETGWRKKRLPHWIWLAQSALAAFVLIRERRTQRVAKELLQDAQARVISTDRYAAYNWLKAERNQVCRAHLRRDWIKMAQRAGPLGEHGKELLKLEKTLHRDWNQWRQDKLERGAFEASAEEIRKQIEEICRQADQCPGAPGVVRWVLKEEHKERCWVFIADEKVELTNNQSERDVRTCVIQRKLSFGSQSEAGLRLMERLWTVALTCERQSKSVLDFMEQAVSAHRLGESSPQLV